LHESPLNWEEKPEIKIIIPAKIRENKKRTAK
jgi:hypothetical protein